MSVQTARLAEEHHKLGKPGGPGLFHNKSLQLPAYIQNIARALMKEGHPKSMAISIAIATVKRWAAGGGKVKPEVRAAAAKAVAEWEKDKAVAHAHSNEHTSTVELSQPKGHDMKVPAPLRAAARAEAAKRGVALPDGSYPIPNTTYLKKAIHAYGRRPTPAVKAHIVKRAKALNAISLLPDNWDVKLSNGREGMLDFTNGHVYRYRHGWIKIDPVTGKDMPHAPKAKAPEGAKAVHLQGIRVGHVHKQANGLHQAYDQHGHKIGPEYKNAGTPSMMLQNRAKKAFGVTGKSGSTKAPAGVASAAKKAVPSKPPAPPEQKPAAPAVSKKAAWSAKMKDLNAAKAAKAAEDDGLSLGEPTPKPPTPPAPKPPVKPAPVSSSHKGKLTIATHSAKIQELEAALKADPGNAKIKHALGTQKGIFKKKWGKQYISSYGSSTPVESHVTVAAPGHGANASELAAITKAKYPSSHAAGYTVAHFQENLNGGWSPNAEMKTAVKAYSGSLYSNINAHLRKKIPGTAKVKKTIQSMDKAFADVPPLTKDIVVGRGMSSDGPFPGFPPPMTPGAEYIDRGYGSTSKAIGFGGTVKLEIRIPKGKKVIDLNHTTGSNFPHEQEVLLPRGTRYRVISDTVAEQRQIVVQVV